MIDTHCHLDSATFPEGPGEVLSRARSAGVRGFVCIGVGDLALARFAKELSEAERDVVATVGVHPHDALTYDDSVERELKELLRGERVVAVGETGLDYHYDHSPRSVQRRVFERQIALAREVKKPLAIHTRSASQEALEMLELGGAKAVGGVIHCFSEDLPFAERALAQGFDLSFSGIVTFKNARQIQEVAKWAPLDSILIETDSPYLAPVPMRGKRCEPAFLVHTLRFIAQLRNMSVEALSEATTANALRRFGPSLARAAGAPQTA